MYRVELKDRELGFSAQRTLDVPNVPCGVESHKNLPPAMLGIGVPNVPCGVESTSSRAGSQRGPL